MTTEKDRSTLEDNMAHDAEVQAAHATLGLPKNPLSIGERPNLPAPKQPTPTAKVIAVAATNQPASLSQTVETFVSDIEARIAKFKKDLGVS